MDVLVSFSSGHVFSWISIDIIRFNLDRLIVLIIGTFRVLLIIKYLRGITPEEDVLRYRIGKHRGAGILLKRRNKTRKWPGESKALVLLR